MALVPTKAAEAAKETGDQSNVIDTAAGSKVDEKTLANDATNQAIDQAGDAMKVDEQARLKAEADFQARLDAAVEERIKAMAAEKSALQDAPDGVDVAELIAKNPVRRTFKDVEVTPITIEEKIFAEESVYTYKHNRTRDFRCGPFGFEFHFKDYILTINSESENQRWLDVYETLPIDERFQIVEYHPELLAQVERPVGTAGQAYGQKILRGAVPTSQMNDPRAINRPKA